MLHLLCDENFNGDIILAGQTIPGLFVINDSTPIRHVIDELLLLDECSTQAEWFGFVIYLPL